MTGDASPEELRYELRIPGRDGVEAGAAPVRDGAPVAVLLHGRGADRHDLLGLADHLLPGAILVTPQAPFPGEPWGYGGGWAWYRYRGDDRVDPDALARSVALLDRFLDRLPEILPVEPGPVLVGGFSQGGTTSLTHALRHPGRSVGVAVLSGFLPRATDRGEAHPDARGTRVFWGHGTLDPAVYHGLAVKGRATLVSLGAEVTARDYRTGHTITPAEMADLRGWWSERLEEAAGARLRGG